MSTINVKIRNKMLLVLLIWVLLEPLKRIVKETLHVEYMFYIIYRDSFQESTFKDSL